MTAATFARRLAPEYGCGVELVEVDCVHGTTSVVLMGAGGGRAPSELEARLAAATAVWTHHHEERCGCTRYLRRLYGRDGVN